MNFEVDLKAKYPSIHVHRTKGGKPKRIIMNETLTGILKEAIKDGRKESSYEFINPKTRKPYTSIKAPGLRISSSSIRGMHLPREFVKRECRK